MARMRLSDYVVSRLVEAGIRHVFMLTGGGAMHLNDAFGRSPAMIPVFCHHEQALGMAAESYCRLSGRVAAVNVTTGPGGINALNGVHGAFTDSIGMFVISGQVKRDTIRTNAAVGLRQLGDQEADIIPMVAPITKYAVCVQNPADIRYHVEKALWLATTGRPGPVWLDIPIDVQAAPIETDSLHGFDPFSEGCGRPFAIAAERGWLTGAALQRKAREVADALRQARRPVILPGTGVRISGALTAFYELADRLGIPVAPGWNAQDIVDSDHPCYVGHPGTVGDRSGNFAVQNADLVLVLGCRLNIRQISYNYDAFARAAKLVMVDIDAAELGKPTLNVDMPVHADLADFIPALVECLAEHQPTQGHRDYLTWARERLVRYPTVLPEYWTGTSKVNPYCFVETLFDELREGDIIVTANATAAVVAVQAAKLKRGQRLYSNSGSASMGYDLPAAIGAWFGMPAGSDRVICLAGDGSIMQNLQELQTIAGYRIPAKIFLFNNDGYHSIRQSQNAYFADNIVGCGPDSSVSFPDFGKIAHAFGLKHFLATSHDDMRAMIAATLASDGPAICEILTDKAQAFAPKTSSRRLEDGSMVSAPLEDLAPFLSREELADNMLIPILN